MDSPLSMQLTFEQLRLVIVVYASSIVPLLLIPYLWIKNKIPSWTLSLYIICFIACALGWEIWFTYGWIGGMDVNLRRAPVLSNFLPIHINWLLNSLADAGTICMGGLLLTWKIFNKNKNIFYKWNWNVFCVLLIFFITQNILVETFLYYDQLSEGKAISWAPLSPLGPWINPVLLHLQDRTVSLQSQIPWLIMTPLFYGYTIYHINKRNNI